MSNIVYEATPLEQAYSLYLVHQVFGILLPLPNHNTAISISGKNAVSFLTQSGVDRGILRSIWSVADPQNFGSLTEIHQFRVVLRLVAMAQAGLCSSGINTTQTNSEMATSIQRTASQLLPLPVFSNAIVPQSSQLMAMYGHMVVQNNNINNNINFNNIPATPTQPQFELGGATNAPQARAGGVSLSTAATPAIGIQSVGDAFGSLVEVRDAPLTPLRPPQEMASNSTTPMSISDAFASMGPTTTTITTPNAPLPALGENAVLPNNNNNTLTTPIADPSTITRNDASSANTTPMRPGSSGGGGFGFWSLGSATSVVDHANRVNSLGSTTPTPTGGIPQYLKKLSTTDGSFPSGGGFASSFGGTTPQGAAAATTVPSMAANVSDDDDEDDFGDFGSAAAVQPSTIPTNNINDNNIHAGTSRGLSMGSPQRNTMQGGFVIPTSHSTESVSDVFGDMVPVSDAPLPSMDSFGQPTTTTTIPITDNNNNPVAPTDDEDDGFGNFEAATLTPAVTDTPNESSDLVRFSQEEPTPSFQPNETMFVQSDMNQHQQQQQQSFSTSIGLGMSVLDCTTDIAPTSQMMMSVTDNGPSLSITDAFGDMPTPQDAPLPSFGNVMLETTNTAPPSADFIAHGQTNANEIGDGEDDDDGFGAFEDAPAIEASMLSEPDLLQSNTVGPGSGVNNEDETDSDDDFGDFGGASPTIDPTPSLMDAGGQQPTLSSGMDMLGFDSGANTTTNSASLGALSDPSTTNMIPAAQGAVDAGHVRSLSIDDAFGDFAAPADAPLPSLEMIGASGTTSSNLPTPSKPTQVESDPIQQFEDVDDDDDFGGFSEASVPQGVELPFVEGDDDDDDDNEFGDFGTAPSKQAALSPPEQTDLFGSGAGGLSASAETKPMPDAVQALSIPDPFGDMPTNDAPLPSLDMLSAVPSNQIVESNGLDATNNDDSDDDFGGFETPVVVPSVEIGLTDELDLVAPTESGASESLVPDTEISIADAATDIATQSDGNLLGFGGITRSIPISLATSHPAATEPLSVADAFGDFEVADAPLPSLTPARSVENQSASFETQDTDMFGNFTSSNNHSLISVNETVQAENPVKDVGGDLLDMFGTEPQPTIDHVTSCNEVDELRGYGSAEPKADQLQNSSFEEDDFGDFGSAEVTAPAEHNIPLPVQPNVQEDDFGDFGSAETRNSQLEGDGFRDFEGVEATSPVQNNVQTIPPECQDGIGDFGSAESAAPPDDQLKEENDFGDFGSAGFVAAVQQNSQDNDFGDFGSAENTAPVADADHDTKPAEEYDFGDFGSAELTTPVEDAAHNAQPTEEDDFGNFGCAEDTTSMEQNVDDFGTFGSETITSPVHNVPSGEVDFFGAFGSSEAAAPIDQTVEQPRSSDAQHFGGFGSVDSAAPAEQNNTDNIPPEDDDDFGDFGSAEFSSPVKQQNDIVQTESADEFGDFTVVEASQANELESNDNNFGDFASFSPPVVQSQQTSEPTAAIHKDEDDGDEWGDFETVDAPPSKENNELTEEVAIRDRIRSLALQLPDCLLRKAGVSGDHVDLGESFEVNVGIKSSMTETSRRRTQRCIQVLEYLTSTDNSKLASTFWVQIFDVVNEELEQAKCLLLEAASFPSNSWSDIRAPLSVMVRGLAEYMRVTRSIVASIGDVLLLDESAMLTVDTWASTWCSLSVLEKALDCEKKWKEIEHLLIKTTPLLGGALVVVGTVGVEEIRSEATGSHAGTTSTTRGHKKSLCHLTLQPLDEKHKATTKEEVSFQGHCFMASSANFLANRCPFFVVGEEI